MFDQVEKVIQAIRPAIQADDGDIALHDVDLKTGKVFVELFSADVGRPGSANALMAGVERILKDRVEGVTEVVQVGIPPSGPEGDFPTAIPETAVSF